MWDRITQSMKYATVVRCPEAFLCNTNMQITVLFGKKMDQQQNLNISCLK